MCVRRSAGVRVIIMRMRACMCACVHIILAENQNSKQKTGETHPLFFAYYFKSNMSADNILVK